MELDAMRSMGIKVNEVLKSAGLEITSKEALSTSQDTVLGPYSLLLLHQIMGLLPLIEWEQDQACY